MKKLLFPLLVLLSCFLCTACFDNSISPGEAEDALETVLQYYYDTKDATICKNFLENIPEDVLYSYFSKTESYIIEHPQNIYAYGFIDGYNAGNNGIWDDTTEYYVNGFDYDFLSKNYLEWSEY